MRTGPTSRQVLRILLVVAFLASCSDPRSASKNSGSPTAHEVADIVLELDRRWGQAYIKNDFDFVDHLLAPDWQGWLDGKAETKAESMAEFRAGHSSSLENTIDDAHVRVYGGTAIVEARERIKYRDDAGEHTITWRIMDVFVHQCSQWRVVATYESTIPNS